MEKEKSASSASSADEKSRKFSVTCWESVEAELSDDEFQLQLPIYRRILLLDKFVKKTREGLQLKSFSRFFHELI